MRTVSDGAGAITYSKIGLMVLCKHFKQRPIEATFSSFRSMVPLSTPSGPQQVESELEAELLEQLAFARGVYDLITQPIIDYMVNGVPRRYTPDIAIQLHSSGDGAPRRYIIEVKRRGDLLSNASKYTTKFAAGRLAADAMGAAFRIMDEVCIRTPYLHNTRLLQRHLNANPELFALDIMRRAIGNNSVTVAQAVDLLRANGIAEPDARASIEQSVAWRMVICDLALPFTDKTLIRACEVGELPRQDRDPILKALIQADFE